MGSDQPGTIAPLYRRPTLLRLRNADRRADKALDRHNSQIHARPNKDTLRDRRIVGELRKPGRPSVRRILKDEGLTPMRRSVSSNANRYHAAMRFSTGSLIARRSIDRPPSGIVQNHNCQDDSAGHRHIGPVPVDLCVFAFSKTVAAPARPSDPSPPRPIPPKPPLPPTPTGSDLKRSDGLYTPPGRPHQPDP